MFTAGHGPQEFGIDDDESGLEKGSNQILSRRMIDSRLTADTAVDRRQETGWDLYQADAAQHCCRHEPGQVADNAAPQGDDDVSPLHAPIKEPVVKFSHGTEALTTFTCSHGAG